MADISLVNGWLSEQQTASCWHFSQQLENFTLTHLILRLRHRSHALRVRVVTRRGILISTIMEVI